MLEELVEELVELYLDRAGVSYVEAQQALADRKPILQFSKWLRTIGAANEERLEDILFDTPFEWNTDADS